MKHQPHLLVLVLQNDDRAYLEHQIKGVTIDSRHVEKEMLFVPFKGENVDGHALANCCKAVNVSSTHIIGP
jgi:UDP-N-acetylmuramyl pentapeptide synthase